MVIDKTLIRISIQGPCGTWVGEGVRVQAQELTVLCRAPRVIEEPGQSRYNDAYFCKVLEADGSSRERGEQINVPVNSFGEPEG